MTVMMYLWTVPGHDSSSLRTAIGVSDDADSARRAAETVLRTGKARRAYIECACVTIGLGTLSLCYERTGAGWRGELSQEGPVIWVPFNEGISGCGDTARDDSPAIIRQVAREPWTSTAPVIPAPRAATECGA